MSFWCCCLLLLCGLFLGPVGSEKLCRPGSEKTTSQNVTIGGMMIDSSSFLIVLSTAFQIAVEDLNADPCLLHSLSFFERSTFFFSGKLIFFSSLDTSLQYELATDNRSPTRGLQEYLRLGQDHSIVGLIGSGLSGVSRAISLASPLFETPQISFASTASELSDKDIHPLFSRVVPANVQEGKNLARICEHFNWDRVAIISTSAAFATSITKAFAAESLKRDVSILSSSSFPSLNKENLEEGKNGIRAAIHEVKRSQARVVVLVMGVGDAVEFFCVSDEEHFLDKNINFLGNNGLSTSLLFEGILAKSNETYLQRMNEKLLGLLAVSFNRKLSGPVFEEFQERWREKDPLLYPFAGPNTSVSIFPALVYDATRALGLAIDYLLEHRQDVRDGVLLYHTIVEETDFEGLTGRIHFDQNGDRKAVFEVVNLQSANQTKDCNEEIGCYVSVREVSETGVKIIDDVIFQNGKSSPPDAAERVFVSYSDVAGIVMVSFASLGILLTLLGILMVHRYHQTPIMHYSSPRFAYGISFGVLVGFCLVFAMTGEPSDQMCQAKPWLFVFNLVLVFGHLYAKAFRFLYIMKRRSKLSFTPISDFHLFLCVGLYALIFVIPLSVWTGAYPLSVERVDDTDPHKVNLLCGGDNDLVFVGVVGGLLAFSLIVGVIIAWLNRSYNDFFSDATYVGYTMFTICLIVCVATPILVLLYDTPEAFYVVFMIAIFLGNGAVLFFLFCIKAWIIIFEPKKNKVPVDHSGKIILKSSDATPSSMF